NMFTYDYVTPDTVRNVFRQYNNDPTFLPAPIDTAEYFTDGTQRHKFYGAYSRDSVSPTRLTTRTRLLCSAAGASTTIARSSMCPWTRSSSSGGPCGPCTSRIPIRLSAQARWGGMVAT